MRRRNQIRVESLFRLLIYILGHRPDEFGLVPDPSGYIRLKELLRAIHEEPGYGYVREADVREVLMGDGRSLFETEDSRIRALDRRWRIEASIGMPHRILYFAVRKRAHAPALEKGLSSDRNLPFSADPEFALKIGRRRDPNPVLLEIRASAAQREGAVFCAFGSLYLAKEIPPGCISGPPVEEEKPSARPGGDTGKTAPNRTLKEFMPGSFVLDAGRDPATHRRQEGKRNKGWKEHARKLRKRGNR